MKEKDAGIICGRLKDLAAKAAKQDIYTFSDFLGLSEQSLFFGIQKELDIGYKLFGGAEGCERVMVRFGDPARIGYEQDFPISCIRVEGVPSPEGIGHRDVLGALMNLGMRREMLGDIIIRDEGIFLFCTEKIAEFITENLVQVKRTVVLCKIYEGLRDIVCARTVDVEIQVPSVRLDVILAKAFGIKRGEAASLIKEGRAFINGREIKNDSKSVNEADIVSLRGHGRIRYTGEVKSTRKGNLIVRVERFV